MSTKQKNKTVEVSMIDTSKMSKGKAEALEIAEAARDKMTEKSLAGGLFVGEINTSNAYPWPAQKEQDQIKGEKYVREIKELLDKEVDPDEIDRTGEIPEEVFKKLADIGAFALKVPESFGGRGLSQYYYSKGAEVTGVYCANIASLLSAHQSIGVPQPLLMYGTEEQKAKYLPRFAEGEVSAFALTEPDVGSDPARMKTEAKQDEDGDWIINGEKLWCTNGTKAGVIIVMARTPDKNGKKQITAFIVDMDTKGVKVTTRCHFMGLRALYNGVIKFDNVRVSPHNIVLSEGKGMRVALNTLNIGRLTIPAICIGAAKKCLQISRKWTSTRSQWGQEIGKHQALADKLARMAADIFAMEAMVDLCTNIVDKKNADIRVESAMAKMWATEAYWRIVDNTMQLKGGRGYETAESLENRGEEPDPIERMFRDSRINLIFEGSSEIMRLILAREALDPHLKVAGAVLNTKLPLMTRLKAAIKSGLHYALWYPKQWLPLNTEIKALNPKFKDYHNYVCKTSRRLAKVLFHSMIKHGPGLDKQQLLLSRLVEIGTELFVITASMLKADDMLKKYPDKTEIYDLIKTLFNNCQNKIENNFFNIKNNSDKANHSFGKKVLKGKYKFLETI